MIGRPGKPSHRRKCERQKKMSRTERRLMEARVRQQCDDMVRLMLDAGIIHRKLSATPSSGEGTK
jgi:hypothetical protein